MRRDGARGGRGRGGRAEGRGKTHQALLCQSHVFTSKYLHHSCGQRPWQKLEPFHSLSNCNCRIEVEIFCEEGHNSDENRSSRWMAAASGSPPFLGAWCASPTGAGLVPPQPRTPPRVCAKGTAERGSGWSGVCCCIGTRVTRLLSTASPSSPPRVLEAVAGVWHLQRAPLPLSVPWWPRFGEAEPKTNGGGRLSHIGYDEFEGPSQEPPGQW